MAKGENQKLKMLYLRDLLMETDAEHPVTMEEILSQLKERHVDAERKSIYSDMEALRSYGLDIALKKLGRTAAYYLNTRDFEASELKMLIDSVQVAPFLSERRSQKLMQKIAAMSSRYTSDLQAHRITDIRRNKAQNDSLFRVLDSIQNAIIKDVQIRFRYWCYGPDKKQLFLHGGKALRVSPFSLVSFNSCFYLAAFNPEANACMLYRADRMSNVTLLQNPRTGKEEFAFYDIPDLPNEDVPKQPVVLRVDQNSMDALIDRFGHSVSILRTLSDAVLAEVSTGVGPDLFGWIVSQNGKVFIETEEVLGAYRAYLKALIDTN